MKVGEACDHATGRRVREEGQPNHVLGLETMASI